MMLGILGGATTHLLLASLNQHFETLAPELDAAQSGSPNPWMRLWQRDRGVLQLARPQRTGHATSPGRHRLWPDAERKALFERKAARLHWEL
jgi:hypothetical protein